MLGTKNTLQTNILCCDRTPYIPYHWIYMPNTPHTFQPLLESLGEGTIDRNRESYVFATRAATRVLAEITQTPSVLEIGLGMMRTLI